MSFPAEVRAEMGRQGLRPSQLSARSGIHETQISRKVTREDRGLSVEEAVALGEALGVPAWELLRRAQESQQTTRSAAS